MKLEDMMSAGTEPLEGLDEFMQSWISYLRKQNDTCTSRLLIEAVVYQSEIEGLLEEAKRCANQHPRLFIKVLEEFYSSGQWEKLVREGNEKIYVAVIL